MTIVDHLTKLTDKLVEAQDRNMKLQAETLLLRGEISNLAERLGKWECPSCGESEEVVECRHDGETCGVPECDYKYCNHCFHQWGHN